MTDTTLGTAIAGEGPSVTCPFCMETVPQAPFCMLCGRQMGQLDLSKIFTSSERAAGYAEVDQRAPLARTLGPAEGSEHDALDEPAVEHEQPAVEPDARPALRVLFGGLFGRSARPMDADDAGEDVAASARAENGNPSVRTLFGSWFRHAPEDADADADAENGDTPTSDTDTTGRRFVPAWLQRPSAIFIVGVPVAVVGALIASLVLIPQGQQPATPVATTATPVTTLPGWGKERIWSNSGAVGTVGVTSDGNYVGYAHGRTVTVLYAGSGRTAATLTLPGKAVGGVSAVTVDGKPALAAASKTAVAVWGAGKVRLEAGIPTGGKFQVRGGVPFVVTNTTAVMLTGHGAVPVTFPRPGALIIGGTSNGQVLWASARGEVLTAATNGTITRIATLEAPKGATEISSWIVATASTVWVRWKTGDKGTVLAAHNAGDGKVISTTSTASDDPIAASQDGSELLVQGTVFTAAGKTVDVPKRFVADGFVGDHLYGADQDGTTAYVDDDTVRTGPAPTVIPVAENSSGDLIAATNGDISSYATTHQHTTDQHTTDQRTTKQ